MSLCANCHGLVHTVAKARQRGKSGDDKLSHLAEDAANRVRVLVQMILLASLDDATNPRPLISAVLDSPRYLDALKRYQSDIGASSQEVAINVIFRSLAVRYGLVDEEIVSRGGAKSTLSEVRRKR